MAFAGAGLTAAIAWITVALAVPGRPPPPAKPARPAGAVRLPAGAAQPLGLRLLAGLLRAHAGDERAARLGRGLPRLGRGQQRHDGRAAVAHRRHHRARPSRHAHQRPGQRGLDPLRPAAPDRRRHGAVDRGRAAAGLRRLPGLLARRRADRGLRHDHLARTRRRSPPAPRVPPIRRAAAPRSPCIRCWVTPAASSARW